MNYIYDYISEERKKEIADMNIVDTYQHTGYLKIPKSSPFLCVNSSFSYIKYVYAAFIFSNVL